MRKSQIKTFTLSILFMLPLILYAQTAEEHYNRGSAYYRNNDFNNAIIEVTEAIKLAPNSSVAYHARGITYYEIGDYTNAISDLNNSIRLDPDDTYSYMYRGGAYYQIGDYVNAIADFAVVLYLQPDNVNAKNNIEVIRQRLQTQTTQEIQNYTLEGKSYRYISLSEFKFLNDSGKLTVGDTFVIDAYISRVSGIECYLMEENLSNNTRFIINSYLRFDFETPVRAYVEVTKISEYGGFLNETTIIKIDRR